MHYIPTELLPSKQPFSIFGKAKARLLDSSLAEFFRVRDGWEVYPDGGAEAEYQNWRAERARGKARGIADKQKGSHRRGR